MIKIQVGIDSKTHKDIIVSSDDVSAVVFPCSGFESVILWRELQDRYGFRHEELIDPKVTKPLMVDWVYFLGEMKLIQVCCWCWQVKGVYLCLVEPQGDFFSYDLVESWLRGHFNCTYDRGNRRAIFNPMNFHNCVAALKEAIAKHGKI